MSTLADSSEPSAPRLLSVQGRLRTLQESLSSLSNDWENARSVNDFMLITCSRNKAATRLVSESVLLERRDTIAETIALMEDLGFRLFSVQQLAYDMEWEGGSEDQTTQKLDSQFDEISDMMARVKKNAESLHIGTNAMIEKLAEWMKP
ncbi:hypothetical protein MRS44_018723 [Fusarium solani]|uniref:uncharacterized protein n=1 Tax=Fusarium solani TaxID=169388 RepID=UPI0032C3E288|nr:hypothetical protein MRS44_018723 [Fusarium solani]